MNHALEDWRTWSNGFKTSPGHKNRSLVLLLWIPHCLKVTIFSVFWERTHRFCYSIWCSTIPCNSLNSHFLQSRGRHVCGLKTETKTNRSPLTIRHLRTWWEMYSVVQCSTVPRMEMICQVIWILVSESPEQGWKPVLLIFRGQDFNPCTGGGKFKCFRSQEGNGMTEAGKA